jgi:metal-dependent HD superfamily phosphatase/phosphodiesterase
MELSNQYHNTIEADIRATVESKYDQYYQMATDLEDYGAILFHKNVAKCQRLAYNDHHQNVASLRNKIMIEVDFKEKIKIGLSPREVSKEFYSQTQRSWL